jgi:cell division protease FtsH
MTDRAKRNDAITSVGSRPKESERETRRPAQPWDRVRVFVFLIAAFLLLVASNASASGLSFREVLRQETGKRWWLLALALLEVIRQFHYFFEERSKGYYALWRRAWTSRSEMASRMDPWTRYRLGRLVKLLAFFWLFGAVMAAFFSSGGDQVNPIEAWFLMPGKLRDSFGQIIYFAFLISFGIMQFAAIFWFMSKGGVETIMPDEIETRFTDVKGQDSVLDRVKENIVFLENPEAIESRGGYVPGGILLWGPPGTGKTLMAQAVAGETGKPYVAVDPGAFQAMFLGVGILKVKSLYRKLRKLAQRYEGVIVFFDEADSLGNRGMAANPGGWNLQPTEWSTGPGCNGVAYLSGPGRHDLFVGHAATRVEPGKQMIFMGGMGMGGGMGTLQALLSSMDGLKKPRGLVNRIRRWLGMKPTPPPKYRILHIFATNQPQSLDEAMLRPGRIDRLYKVGFPHLEGRKATFWYYLEKVSHELSDEQVTKLATITPYASGASIKDMVNEALVIALRAGRETITYEDVIQAKQIKQHGLPEDHEYIERERHSVAVHEACHAVVAYHLRKHMIIDIATIERRGDVGGFVSSLPPEDQFVTWRSEREIDVMTFLASLAGERMFFDDDHSTGVGGDMRGATALTLQMLAFYAMGDTIASHSITKAGLQGAQPAETGADRNIWDGEFGKSVEAKLRELYDRTMEILKQNRGDVLAVAHALETRKTITGEDVAAIIEGTEGALIDGRPYQDGRFREELEEYHQAAVSAHLAHGEVGADVPIPVPPAPALVGTAAISRAHGGNGQRQQRLRIGSGDPPRPDAR